MRLKFAFRLGKRLSRLAWLDTITFSLATNVVANIDRVRLALNLVPFGVSMMFFVREVSFCPCGR
jgi:hypothetical protein